MDEKQTVQDLKDTIQSFCIDRDWDQFHSPKEFAISISKEASQLLDHFGFKLMAQLFAMIEDPS